METTLIFYPGTNAMALEKLLLFNMAIVALLMLAVWLVSLVKRDVSIVDIAWGSGFVLIAWGSFWATGSGTTLQILLLTLTTLWGLRLSGYLAWRNHGRPEDYRYREMRQRQGASFAWKSLLTVFGLQGLIMWAVSLPLQTGQIAENQKALGFAALIGVVLWLIGFLFESIGDYQLARFKSDPQNRGQVMDRGLWRYTRHPNYFGDFLVWWGLYFVSFGRGLYWWSLIGPLVMSIFLMKISGVTLLEKSLKESKPGYEDYIRRTSAFFPLPPSE